MNIKLKDFSVYLVIGITLLCILALGKIRLEFDLDRMVPTGNEDRMFYDQFRHDFQAEVDDHILLIGLECRDGLFQKTFLESLDQLTNALTRLDKVQKVFSLSNSPNLFFNGTEWQVRPVIHSLIPDRYREDSIRLYQSPEYRDLFLSRNRQSVSIAVFHADGMTANEKDQLTDSIKFHLNKWMPGRYHLAGQLLIERSYVREIIQNFKTFSGYCSVLVLLVLGILFRSWKGILLPVVIIAASILWTLALLVILDDPVDLLSSLVPPILAIITLSGVIHFAIRHAQLRTEKRTHDQALDQSFKTIGFAVWAAAITTAFGFYSLYPIPVESIRAFGWAAGSGVLFSFFVMIVLMWKYLPDCPPGQQGFRIGSSGLFALGRPWFGWILKYRTGIMPAALLLLLISLIGLNKVEINGSFLREIPEHIALRADYDFMEKEFYGTRPVEISFDISGNSGSFFELERMRQIDRLESYLKDSMGVGALLSPVNLLKSARKAFHGGHPNQFTLPDSQEDMNLYLENIRQSQFADELNRFMTVDGKRLRISGKLPDLSLKQYAGWARKWEGYMQQQSYEKWFSYRLTGISHLMDQMALRLVDNLFTSLALAFLLLASIIYYLFRSVRLIWIALVPNVLSLLIVGSLMGFFGIYLKTDTAILFSIAFGIGVDHSIHLLSQIRNERNLGYGMAYAVKRALYKSGPAIILVTLILGAGFMILMRSSFGSIQNIGLLITVNLLCSMLLTMILMPALLLRCASKTAE